MTKEFQLVIITGMSGAGKTVAMRSLEDLGFFCIDNMPPSLLPKFLELVKESGKLSKVALAIDLRSRAFYKDVIETLGNLSQDNGAKIIFLDASDEELVSRYKETRRAHPLARNGRVLEGIKKERDLLAQVRQSAQFVIDTSNLAPKELREEIFRSFEANVDTPFHIEMMSFGFKYGVPIDADIVMDVRFLPNPYYIPELRSKTGQDKPVYDYVMAQPETTEFYERFLGLLSFMMPCYKKEGKTSLTVAIGCTGGQHRSVALVERLSEALGDKYPVHTSNRDVEKSQGGAKH